MFWGFCAFALITLNHFADGFRRALPDRRESGFGRFYFGFVAVWAVAVAVSIAGLFVRRFVVRPIWLGKVSPESGFIALLIFAADGRRISPGCGSDEESLAGQRELVGCTRWRCWSSCR